VILSALGENIMAQFEIEFRITRDYKVRVEAANEDVADSIAQDMTTDKIEELGAGTVKEDVEILIIRVLA
jgi:hypothetical protein